MLLRIAAVAGMMAVAAAMAVTPAHALTMQECSVKYKAAQDAGTLNGLKWNDFRKAECGADATAAAPAATHATAEDPSEPNVTNTEHTAEPAKPTTRAPRGVVFPKAVDNKYSDQSPGKARMRTCLDQYYANKSNNALGGLKWIQKGGGFYSLCNARLKS